jgi:aconitase A
MSQRNPLLEGITYPRPARPAVVDPVDPVEQEIAALRKAEREEEINVGIQDCVMYDLLPLVPAISNAAKMAAYKKAIARFADRWPADMVRMYVDASIRKLLAQHHTAMEVRRRDAAEKAKRRGRRAA